MAAAMWKPLGVAGLRRGFPKRENAGLSAEAGFDHRRRSGAERCLLGMDSQQSDTPAAAMLGKRDEGRLFRIALTFLMILLFCETYLAWHFGSSTA